MLGYENIHHLRALTPPAGSRNIHLYGLLKNSGWAPAQPHHYFCCTSLFPGIFSTFHTAGTQMSGNDTNEDTIQEKLHSLSLLQTLRNATICHEGSAKIEKIAMNQPERSE